MDCIILQGPLGWQSFSGLPVGESVLHRNIDFSINSDEHAEMNAISWEAIIQRHIEDELYDSSREVLALLPKMFNLFLLEYFSNFV